jgi:hypothetical protein
MGGIEDIPVVFGFWVMGDWLLVAHVLEGICKGEPVV